MISLSQSSASITLVWPWFNPSRSLSLSPLTGMDWLSFQNHTQKTQLFCGIGSLLITVLPCYHLALARTFSFQRARTRSATTSKGFLICIALSPWPMYYQCKWSVQLAFIVFFTSKCLRNEVIGSLTLSAEVISRSKTINGTLKRTITFCPRDFCLRYYLDLSRSFFLYKVRHLWNVLWLKLVDVFIRHSLIKLMSRSIPLDGFYPWLLFHKDQDVWDTISMVH